MRTFLFLIMFGPLSGLAQNFVTYTQKDGLSSDKVVCFTEDQQGFLWVGTGEGLNRFDGVNFKKYFHDANDSTSLGHDQVNALHQSTDGYLWISSFGGGFGRFDPRIEQFVSWQDLTGAEEPTVERAYADIYSRHDDSLWVSLEHFGMALMLPKEKRQELYPITDGTTRKVITCIKADPEDPNILWIASVRNLYRFSISDGTYEVVEIGQNLKDDPVGKFSYQDIYFQTNDDIWLALWGGGLVHWNRKSNEWNRYLLNTEPPFHGAKNVFKSILPLDEHRLACGVEIGIATFDFRTKSFSKIQFDRNDPFALPDGYTGNLFRASDGVIWIAARKGLVKWDPALNVFRTITLPPVRSDELVSSCAGVIDHDGDLLVATTIGNGLLLYKDDSDTPVEVVMQPDEPYYDLHHLEKINDSTALVFADDKILLLDLETYVSKSVFERGIRQFGNQSCMSFLKDEKTDNVYWLGKQDRGVYRYDLESETITHIYGSDRSGEARHWPQGLAFDKKGDIWVSGPAGLIKIDGKNYGHELYSVVDYPALGSDYIWDLCIDKQGMLWLGTNGKGLVRTDPADVGGPSTRNFTRYEGLPSLVSSLSLDPEGMMWIGGRAGIWRMDPIELEVRKFDHSDGLRTNDFHHASAWFMDDGKAILVNGQASFIQVDRKSLQTPSPKLKAVLTSLNVNGKALAYDTITNYLNSLTLPHDQNYLELAYNSIVFSQRSHLKLGYRMVGVDEQVIPSPPDQRVVYADLDPGEYRFVVYGTSAENELHSLRISIQPAFWQTWWFKTILVIMGLLLAFILARWRMRVLKLNQELEIGFNKRLAEVEMTALRSQMNPHFLFNSLNSINRYILKSEPEVASEYLTKFSRLMRAVLQNSKEDLVLLGDELDALTLYMDLEALRFKGKFLHSVSIDMKEGLNQLLIPPLILQPYVENAIWHGLMHRTEADGILEMKVLDRGERLMFMIEDNGVGREKAEEMKSKSATKQRSFGTVITAERIEIANRYHAFDLKVRTEDLYNERDKPRGTRVVVSMIKKRK